MLFMQTAVLAIFFFWFKTVITVFALTLQYKNKKTIKAMSIRNFFTKNISTCSEHQKLFWFQLDTKKYEAEIESDKQQNS